jgi:hypothetical protein
VRREKRWGAMGASKSPASTERTGGAHVRCTDLVRRPHRHHTNPLQPTLSKRQRGDSKAGTSRPATPLCGHRSSAVKNQTAETRRAPSTERQPALLRTSKPRRPITTLPERTRPNPPLSRQTPKAAERQGQRREPAADDVEFVSERIGWLPFAAPSGWSFLM